MGMNIIILYGVGGLSDVGRHAVLAALERPIEEIQHITVITQHPELITTNNDAVTDWNCGCNNEPSHILSSYDPNRITIVPIEPQQSWDNIDLTPYLKPSSEETITSIISCLGNRQPFNGHWDAYSGNKAIVRAIENINVGQERPKEVFRIVIITSVGINEDWPAIEFFMLGRIIMSLIFTVLARPMYNDLSTMEQLYQQSSSNLINYLLVRPVGLTEDVIPTNQWILQKEKYKHVLGFEMSKLDVARFMIQETLQPTQNRCAVVIGSDPTIPVQRIPKSNSTKQNRTTT